jgi:hypothetical protein
LVVSLGPLVFRVHAIKRMFQRRVSKDDVRHVLESGETIETYAHDTPYPSRLVLGWSNARPLHVVAADNAATGETIVITVYEPDPEEWERDCKRRKQR